MGLKSDLSEVAQVWKAARWRVRAFLALSVFLASGSVASLSETVFKWKGFFLDSVAFYRVTISEPIARLLREVLQLSPPPGFIEYMIVGALSCSAVLRAIYFRRRALRDRIFFTATVVLPYVLNLAIMAKSAVSMNPLYAWLIYAMTLALVWLVGRGAPRLLAVGYMLAPPVLVSMAAAVNAGLTR